MALTKLKIVFLPNNPHLMNAEAVKAAALMCNAKLPRLTANIRACGSQLFFKAHVKDLQEVIRKPRVIKVKLKP